MAHATSTTKSQIKPTKPLSRQNTFTKDFKKTNTYVLDSEPSEITPKVDEQKDNASGEKRADKIVTNKSETVALAAGDRTIDAKIANTSSVESAEKVPHQTPTQSEKSEENNDTVDMSDGGAMSKTDNDVKTPDTSIRDADSGNVREHNSHQQPTPESGPSTSQNIDIEQKSTLEGKNETGNGKDSAKIIQTVNTGHTEKENEKDNANVQTIPVDEKKRTPSESKLNTTPKESTTPVGLKKEKTQEKVKERTPNELGEIKTTKTSEATIPDTLENEKTQQKLDVDNKTEKLENEKKLGQPEKDVTTDKTKTPHKMDTAKTTDTVVKEKTADKLVKVNAKDTLKHKLGKEETSDKLVKDETSHKTGKENTSKKLEKGTMPDKENTHDRVKREETPSKLEKEKTSNKSLKKEDTSDKKENTQDNLNGKVTQKKHEKEMTSGKALEKENTSNNTQEEKETIHDKPHKIKNEDISDKLEKEKSEDKLKKEATPHKSEKKATPHKSEKDISRHNLEKENSSGLEKKEKSDRSNTAKTRDETEKEMTQDELQRKEQQDNVQRNAEKVQIVESRLSAQNEDKKSHKLPQKVTARSMDEKRSLSKSTAEKKTQGNSLKTQTGEMQPTKVTKSEDTSRVKQSDKTDDNEDTVEGNDDANVEDNTKATPKTPDEEHNEVPASDDGHSSGRRSVENNGAAHRTVKPTKSVPKEVNNDENAEGIGDPEVERDKLSNQKSRGERHNEVSNVKGDDDSSERKSVRKIGTPHIAAEADQNVSTSRNRKHDPIPSPTDDRYINVDAVTRYTRRSPRESTKSDDTLETLNQEAHNILESVEKLRAENERIVFENDSLQRENENLQQALRNAAAELSRQDKHYNKRIKVVNRDLDSAMRMIDNLETDLSETRREVMLSRTGVLKKQKITPNSPAKEKNSTAQSALVLLHEKNATNEDAIKVLSTENKRLEQHNNRIDKSLKDEIERRNLVQKLLENVISTNEAFRVRLQQVKGVENAYEQLKVDYAELQAKYQEIMSTNTRMLPIEFHMSENSTPSWCSRLRKSDENDLRKRIDLAEKELIDSRRRVDVLEDYLRSLYNGDLQILLKSNIYTSAENAALALPSIAYNARPDLTNNSYAALSRKRKQFKK